METMTKYTNKSKILGKIGTENYVVSDCPVHLPKENIKFFKAMQDAGNKDPFSSETYHNQLVPNWKKKIHENFDFNSNSGLLFENEEKTGFIFEGECGCECGGVGGSYNTPMNTVGVGNVVPAGQPALSGASQASDMFNGSGDLALSDSHKKNKKKGKIKYFSIAIKK